MSSSGGTKGGQPLAAAGYFEDSGRVTQVQPHFSVLGLHAAVERAGSISDVSDADAGPQISAKVTTRSSRNVMGR